MTGLLALVIVVAWLVVCYKIGRAFNRWWMSSTTPEQRVQFSRRTRRNMNGVLKMYGLKK